MTCDGYRDGFGAGPSPRVPPEPASGQRALGNELAPKLRAFRLRTPTRIARFVLPSSDALESWAAEKIDATMKVISASLAPYQESAMTKDSKPDMFINPRYPGATPEMVVHALLRPREPEEESDSDRESRSDGDGEFQSRF